MQKATDQEAAALTAKLLGVFPMGGENPEIFQAEVKRRFLEFSPEAGVRAIDSLINRYKRMPPIVSLMAELREYQSVIDFEQRPRLVRPRTPEYTVRPEDVRNRDATAAMMRALARARVSEDPWQAHEEILSVAKHPERWPAWLDQHGDQEWHDLPAERRQ